MTQRIADEERETIEGLQRAGFKIEWGIDSSGIARLYYTRGGGYYVDVGCSKLIIDGKIKVHQSPEGISGFTPDAVVLKDGTHLNADVVVLATGYDNMKTTVQKVMGKKVAERCNDVWDLDEEGELNAVSAIDLTSTSTLCLTSIKFRFGDPAVTQTFGSWVEISPCVAFIQSTWHCRSKQLRKG
jgi:hypothetical protein